jgi:hypothetical protein
MRFESRLNRLFSAENAMNQVKALPCIFLLSLCAPVSGQGVTAERIAILPFRAIGLDESTAQSAESILRLEIGRLGAMELVSEKRTDRETGSGACTDQECAVEVGRKLDADRVVACTLSRLGEKVIAQFLLVDVSGRTASVEDRMTAATVEDLDAVMSRIAAAIVKSKPVEETVEVGTVTRQEAQTPRRRAARNINGFSFGYLYPRHGYEDAGRVFAMDFRTGAEFQDYAVGMQLLIRKGFGVNVFSSYLFSRRDFCPYVGGAFGFHWISHPHYYEDGYYSYDNTMRPQEEKRADGFEVSVDSGIRLFHTYNFQMLFNLGYSITLNDYHDQGVLFTFGLLR